MSQSQSRVRIILWLLLLVMAVTPNVYAADQVSVKAWLGSEQQSDQHYSVRQQVVLVIDVGTTRWFTGGTQIGPVDVPNVMTKQRNTLATNYTENVDGQTWSRQHWELTLYPQVSGDYVVPPIAVKVKVSGSDGHNVEKTLYTQPLKFSAQLPSGELSGDDTWLASPKVSVKQAWSASHDDLQVGDSVTRSVDINAVDTLSVLIPAILSEVNPSSTSSRGYQRYLKPPVLVDTQNRGSYQSARHEEVTYVLQQGGEVQFPELQLTWWNTQTKQLEQVTLPGVRYQVRHTLNSWLGVYGVWLLVVAGVIAMVVAAIWSIKRFYRDRPLPIKIQFRRALKHQRWPLARTLFYRKLRQDTGLTSLQAYSPDSTLPCRDESGKVFVQLWNRVRRRSRLWPTHRWLNPLGLEHKLDLESKDKKNGA